MGVIGGEAQFVTEKLSCRCSPWRLLTSMFPSFLFIPEFREVVLISINGSLAALWQMFFLLRPAACAFGLDAPMLCTYTHTHTHTQAFGLVVGLDPQKV